MIDIIGAGIGGLTLGIALQQKQIPFRIFEQAKTMKPVGAGIILANNAMQVYQKMGIHQKIKSEGNPINKMNITQENLKTLSSMDLTYFEDKYQVGNTAIHRGALQTILLDHIDQNYVFLDHRLESIQTQSDHYTLKFENKKTYESGILIGADGIYSTVRSHMFDNHSIRDAQQICWRGVLEYSLPTIHQNELNEAWGANKRFGCVQIAPNKVYWYALHSMDRKKEDFKLESLENYFSDFHRMIQDILKSTPKENIHTAKIEDLLAPKAWHLNNVCLMGDAAHATTPNMGQGACQSIEDAYVLSECLERLEIPEAFLKFQSLRKSKVKQVVDTSWMIGKVSHWKNPLAMLFRNAMMSITPSRIGRQQSAKIFRLNELDF